VGTVALLSAVRGFKSSVPPGDVSFAGVNQN
jgi:hypothetical protein